jgi:hypothetical protein
MSTILQAMMTSRYVAACDLIALQDSLRTAHRYGWPASTRDQQAIDAAASRYDELTRATDYARELPA